MLKINGKSRIFGLILKLKHFSQGIFIATLYANGYNLEDHSGGTWR